MIQYQGRDYDEGTIEAVSLADGRRTVLVRGGAFPRYAPGGFLLFVRKGVLYAVRFDPERLTVEEPATPVLDGVLAWTGDQARGDGSADFAVSDRGDFLYRTSGGQDTGAGADFVWIDAAGQETPAFHEAMFATFFELSPDGRRLAIEGTTARGSGIYIKDLETGNLTPLTTDGADEHYPSWSPDSRRLVYSPRGFTGLRFREPDGTDTTMAFPARYSDGVGAFAWTPDGRSLVAGTFKPETLNDLTLVPLDGEPPRNVVETPRAEVAAQVSPDGRWLAYQGEEKGTLQVFVTAMDQPGPHYQVSPRGGRAVRWSPDGRLLYFIETGGDSQPEWLMTATFDAAGDTPRIGQPRQFLYGLQNQVRTGYAVHPDGRLLFNKYERRNTAPIDSVHVVLVKGWAAELARRLADTR